MTREQMQAALMLLGWVPIRGGNFINNGTCFRNDAANLFARYYAYSDLEFETLELAAGWSTIEWSAVPTDVVNELFRKVTEHGWDES